MWISRVASPPSSTMESGPDPSGQLSICSVHHQYSSSVSPFQAKTGMPCGLSGVPFGPTTTAAAAWSWVEKMLQLTQRTSAPRATRVSISTAVCTVMCSEPAILRPFSGCCGPNSLRSAIRPGISCSASWISLRPNAASDRSATLKSWTRAGAVGGEGAAHTFSQFGRRCFSSGSRIRRRPAGGRCRPPEGRRSRCIAPNQSSTARATSGSVRIRQFEGDVGNREAVFGEQITQTLQTFDLPGSVVSMTAWGPQGRDEPGLLDVAKHPLRPPGRLGGLLDGHRRHGGETLPRLCQVLATPPWFTARSLVARSRPEHRRSADGAVTDVRPPRTRPRPSAASDAHRRP